MHDMRCLAIASGSGPAYKPLLLAVFEARVLIAMTLSDGTPARMIMQKLMPDQVSTCSDLGPNLCAVRTIGFELGSAALGAEVEVLHVGVVVQVLLQHLPDGLHPRLEAHLRMQINSCQCLMRTVLGVQRWVQPQKTWYNKMW